jgi:hypothetical protein
MQTFAVTVERIPGNKDTTERFTIKASDLSDAWDKARAEWRRFGPSSHVIDVHEVPAIVHQHGKE